MSSKDRQKNDGLSDTTSASPSPSGIQNQMSELPDYTDIDWPPDRPHINWGSKARQKNLPRITWPPGAWVRRLEEIEHRRVEENKTE